jgi:hypothetical protein
MNRPNPTCGPRPTPAPNSALAWSAKANSPKPRL